MSGPVTEVRGHHLSLHWGTDAVTNNPEVFCGFSPFMNEPSYLVRLSFGFNNREGLIPHGHFFDLTTEQVKSIRVQFVEGDDPRRAP